ncbi:MAG: UDP-N-acetylmuramate dehydrogenase [Bacteroidetes bacterium]|nr:UDP-N-acetylmuramate dehydrogenase [Bacteroidota bacterium]
MKSLKSLNTFGIDVSAREIYELKSEQEIENLLNTLGDQHFMILGGGSNVLFSHDFDGAIILNRITGKEKIREDENHVWLRIGAGEIWHEVVEFAIANNWGGIENLALIPGCAGAAPIQNIGAYGVEIKDVLESVTAYQISTGDWMFFDNTTCRFGYRDSIFKKELKGDFIITHLVLQLTKKHKLNIEYGAIKEELSTINREYTIRDVADAVIKIRRSKLPDPAVLGNAGSFFKNPVISSELFNSLKSKFENLPGYLSGDSVKIPAGWLIEQSGLKGEVFGNTGSHKQQALVIVNYGGATGKEILEHANRVISTVKEKFGIQLDPEVNIIN